MGLPSRIQPNQKHGKFYVRMAEVPNSKCFILVNGRHVQRPNIPLALISPISRLTLNTIARTLINI